MKGWPTCCVEGCGRPIAPHDSRQLFEIVGYERERRQGGTNHVVARRRTGRVVCSFCAERVQRGEVEGQGQLFG